MSFAFLRILFIFYQLLPASQHAQLIKYLLKTLGTDVCNELCLYAAAESSIHLADNNLSAEQRVKILQDCGTMKKKTVIIFAFTNI